MRELELLRGCSIFAPLPLPTLTQLAGRLEPLDVDAGTEVVREGEPGDRFYLIDGGALEARVGGELRRRLERGDSFGEIALLRDTPGPRRSSRSRGSRLLALDRDEFIAAVTGHAPVPGRRRRRRHGPPRGRRAGSRRPLRPAPRRTTAFSREGMRFNGAVTVAALSDAELVARCRRGDEAAWAALVERFSRYVVRHRDAGLPAVRVRCRGGVPGDVRPHLREPRRAARRRCHPRLDRTAGAAPLRGRDPPPRAHRAGCGRARSSRSSTSAWRDSTRRSRCRTRSQPCSRSAARSSDRFFCRDESYATIGAALGAAVRDRRQPHLPLPREAAGCVCREEKRAAAPSSGHERRAAARRGAPGRPAGAAAPGAGGLGARGAGAALRSHEDRRAAAAGRPGPGVLRRAPGRPRTGALRRRRRPHGGPASRRCAPTSSSPRTAGIPPLGRLGRRARNLRYSRAVAAEPEQPYDEAGDDGLLPAWSMSAAAAPDLTSTRRWPSSLNREWAWGGSTGAGVRVCIVDSGVEADHPLVGGSSARSRSRSTTTATLSVVDDDGGRRLRARHGVRRASSARSRRTASCTACACSARGDGQRRGAARRACAGRSSRATTSST